MSSIDLVIQPDGSVRMIYSETIDLRYLGHPTIYRGSHVEPTREGNWTADLSPVSGPVLGPFVSRIDALAAEVDWLRDHWLLSTEQMLVSQ